MRRYPHMDVFALPDIFTPAPRLARDEPDAAVFSGTPEQVVEYLRPLIVTRAHTIALIAGELRALARNCRPNDSLRFELADSTSVTIRP
jgi:hypothetical protein